jgi:hypothetical protein
LRDLGARTTTPLSFEKAPRPRGRTSPTSPRASRSACVAGYAVASCSTSRRTKITGNGESPAQVHAAGGLAGVTCLAEELHRTGAVLVHAARVVERLAQRGAGTEITGVARERPGDAPRHEFSLNFTDNIISNP